MRDMYTYVCRSSYSISEHMSIPPNITADPVLYTLYMPDYLADLGTWLYVGGKESAFVTW